MKHPMTLFGLLCIMLSIVPLFLMAREVYIADANDRRYEISHTYKGRGFPSTIDVQKMEVNGFTIEIREEPTDEKTSQKWWDEEGSVEVEEPVRIQFLVDGKEVSDADKIQPSTPEMGGRYSFWLDVLLVEDKKRDEEHIAIVQRLSDDDVMQEDYGWKIISITGDGDITEEEIKYRKRSEHPLAVDLIQFSGTSPVAMGYYSDLLHYYPSLFYPLLYPFGTAAAGGILVLLGLLLHWRKRYEARKENMR